MLSYDKLIEQSDKMMSDLPKLIMTNNQSNIIQPGITAEVTKSTKDDIIKLIKRTLKGELIFAIFFQV